MLPDRPNKLGRPIIKSMSICPFPQFNIYQSRGGLFKILFLPLDSNFDSQINAATAFTYLRSRTQEKRFQVFTYTKAVDFRSPAFIF